MWRRAPTGGYSPCCSFPEQTGLKEVVRSRRWNERHASPKPFYSQIGMRSSWGGGAKHLKIDVSHGFRCQLTDVLACVELHNMTGGGGQGKDRRGVSLGRFQGIRTEKHDCRPSRRPRGWRPPPEGPPGAGSCSTSLPTWSGWSWCHRPEVAVSKTGSGLRAAAINRTAVKDV